MIEHFWGLIKAKIGDKRRLQGDPDNEHWQLIPLTPEYLEHEHGRYVKAINNALERPAIRNIALAGNYGVGKSSILQKVAEQHKGSVVELSLSTLAPTDESSIDGSIPKQATTPTNRIQQEIVKQLLYREKPHKAPDSRFQRIERFSWLRELAIASIVGFVITAILLLTGWTAILAAEVESLVYLGLWSHLIVWGTTICIVYSLRRLFYGRINISHLSAGSATVTLDEKSPTFFDQYLDEIVYFFEVSRRNIVVIEDIDRFEDSLIFETLRSLNILLNSAPQIKRPIRFIYAIKDSIFDNANLEGNGRSPHNNKKKTNDPAQSEIIRANRTKFFDLVIPVVPFVTHRSARDLALKLVEGISHNVEPNLIDLACRYFPDMRMLKNVRNEFLVFRDRIFSGDGENLKLNETELYAMMLYKNTHLSDFEEIRTGKSKLDQLYEASRRLIAYNIQLTERKIRSIRQRLNRLEGVTRRSSELGELLVAHIERTARAASYDSQYGNISFMNAIKTAEDLCDLSFWVEYVQAPDDAELTWVSTRNQRQSLRFRRRDIAEALNARLEPEDWIQSAKDELVETLDQHRENLMFLRTADMSDLISRTEFAINNGSETEQPFAEIARNTLSDGLAYRLVRAGYINRNFTLYTSTFHGYRVSTTATNFIIHHVERNAMDIHFSLSESDVEAVLRECADKLSDPVLYNVSILDYLLSQDDKKTETMMNSIVRLGSDEKQFLQTYLSVGEELVKFAECFTRKTPVTFRYLAEEVEIEEEKRLDLMNIALSAMTEKLKYQTSAAVGEYLKASYSELPVLSSPDTDVKQLQRIASLFLAAEVRLPLLEPLSEAARKVFVGSNLYEISLDNLLVAIDSHENLPLDKIRDSSDDIYNYVLINLGTYLSAVAAVSATIASGSEFIAVVEDVLAEDEEQLSGIIAHASEDCIVKDLADVSEGAWLALAEHKRFPATFGNVTSYIRSIGGVDANLGRVLSSAQEIADLGVAEDDAKVQLAKAILVAKEHIPSPAVRACLVDSLALGVYLDVEGIPPEEGELFALLVKYGVVTDSPETYVHLAGTKWPTRERFIQGSEKFTSYITPDLLRGDLALLLSSEKVDPRVKMSLIERADEFIESSNEEDMAQLALSAIQYECQLSSHVVSVLAANGVPAEEIVVLLEPHLETISRDDLFGILRPLGDPYRELTFLGADQPKVPKDQPHNALLNALIRHGVVSKPVSDGDMIRVYKKRKEREKA